jgi:PAS domain S-box-containing protein
MAKKERKQGEGELPDLEVGYHDLYENVPVPYLSVGANGAIRNANEASAEFFGYTRDEILTMEVFDLYAEEAREKAKALLGKLKGGEAWVSEEMVYRKKDGRRVYGLLSVSPVKDELGQVVESRSIIIDITERKLAEEALQIKNYELGERVKELNCLYGISNLVEKSGTFSLEIFQGVVNLIPPSWQ